jgi:hypothetical protein
MTSENWSILEELFHTALTIPHSERRKWLEFRCGENTELIRQVEELLKADNDGNNPLEKVLRKTAASWAKQYFERGA